MKPGKKNELLAIRAFAFRGRALVVGKIATLVAGRIGTGASAVVFDSRNGVWEITIPSSRHSLVLRPQARQISLRKPGREDVVSFDDKKAIASISKRVAKDAFIRRRSLEFFVAMGRAMIAAEKAHRIRFPMLGERTGRNHRGTVRDFVEIDDSELPEGWVGVDLPCFIPCMERCEKDVEFWEIWMHAYCLIKCAIQCGTGGRPI